MLPQTENKAKPSINSFWHWLQGWDGDRKKLLLRFKRTVVLYTSETFRNVYL